MKDSLCFVHCFQMTCLFYILIYVWLLKFFGTVSSYIFAVTFTFGGNPQSQYNPLILRSL
jgi:hypothetical protein